MIPHFEDLKYKWFEGIWNSQFLSAISSNNTVKWFLILAVVVHSTVHTVGAPVQLRPVTDSNGVFPQAAVTSDAQLCSDLGKDVLQRNGSTVDAVITVQLCLGLFVPQSMGIGGGFYMTIYDKKSQKVVVIDARERAPGASTENMFLGNASLSEKGSLSVAVPGELRGLQVAYEMYGRLPWAELIEPVINLCYQGVEVQRSLANALIDDSDSVKADPGLRAVFVDPNTGEVYKLGDTYTNPQLGQTLQIISDEGVDAFYTGQVAKDLVSDLQSLGGIITTDDLGNYTALVKDPVIAVLSNGLKIYGPPPPASGAVLSNIMMILDGYHFSPNDMNNDDSSALLNHRVIEAFKFAYAKRTEMGDDQFVDMSGFINNMTSPEYAAAIRSQIWDNRTFPPDYYGPQFDLKVDHGTSHVSIVGPDGSAVTITSTINLYFGSGILSPKTGVILNDEMDDFSSPNITNYYNVPPSSSNFIVPGKRPVSSTCPSIVINQDGDVVLVTGASGGTRITTAAAYVAVKNLWLSENATQAAQAPRIHDQLYPEYVEYEAGFPEEIIQGLKRKGHLLVPASDSAVTNTIAKSPDGGWEAYADQRKGGGVSGF